MAVAAPTECAAPHPKRYIALASSFVTKWVSPRKQGPQLELPTSALLLRGFGDWRHCSPNQARHIFYFMFLHSPSRFARNLPVLLTDGQDLFLEWS